MLPSHRTQSIRLFHNLPIPHKARRQQRPPRFPIDRQLIQKAPLALLLPSLGPPVIQRAIRKPIHHRDQPTVVRDADKDVVICVELFEAIDALLGDDGIDVPPLWILRHLVEGAYPGIIGITVAGGENGARAWGSETFVEAYPGRYRSRERSIFGGAVGATEMANIPAHEDESIRCGSCQPRYVTDGVTGDIEDVKATVPEKIVRWVLSDFIILLEFNLSNLAAPVELGQLLQGRRHVVFDYTQSPSRAWENLSLMDSLAKKRRRTPAQQSDPPIWGKEMGLRCDPATTRDYS